MKPCVYGEPGTGQEDLGAYQPDNTTHEFGVKVGFHF